MCIASYGWLPPLRGENQGKVEVMSVCPNTLHLFPPPKDASGQLSLEENPFQGISLLDRWLFSTTPMGCGSAVAVSSQAENLDHFWCPLCLS